LHVGAPVAGITPSKLRVPMLVARDTPYAVQLGSVGSTYEVVFRDPAGAIVATPDTNMKFFIESQQKASRLNPNTDFADKFGNLWFVGWFVDND
jgi:hypothetical protein